MQAISPVHVGAGQGVGFVDLPIARERSTNWPYIPSSGLKGVMRSEFASRATTDSLWLDRAFGFAKETAQAGMLVFTDASIFCLPVRSLYGTFAYVTAPLVLKRLVRSGMTDAPSIPDCAEERALVTDSSVLVASDTSRVYLEDLDFLASADQATVAWAQRVSGEIFADGDEWADVFRQRFVILSDDNFRFLCDTATEVNPRIRIDPGKGTVADGAYWYEENLPAETILFGHVWCDSGPNSTSYADILHPLTSEGVVALQVGGHATTGHGRVICTFVDRGGSR